ESMEWGMFGAWTVISFALTLMALACAVATDNLLPEDAATGTRLVLAMAAAAVLGTVAQEVLIDFLPQLEGKHPGEFLNAAHRILFHFTLSAGGTLLLIPLYTLLQASRRANDRLHRMQLAALAAERGVVEGDLRAMQGRVDPELLF